jgi:hypothetical protein
VARTSAAVPTLNLGEPPRAVGARLRAQLAFGGVSQIGWLVFGFGMIFFWVFGARSDFSFVWFWGATESAHAQVLGSYDTHASVNDSPVTRYVYRFEHDGRAYEGEAFGSRPDDPVVAEWPAGDPETSRLRGLRRDVFPWPASFVVIFPFLGFLLLLAGLRVGWRAGNLFTRGRAAGGRLVDKRPTNTHVNDQPVWKLTFEFHDQRGQAHRVVAKTHRPQKLLDEREEPLLYDPVNPKRAVLMDSLPGNPRLSEDGTIGSGSPLPLYAYLALPAIVIVGNVLAAIAVWG